MGKASFVELQDSEGKIQLYLNRDEICPEEDKTMYNQVFKKLLDIGDIIGVSGNVFITQVGEISVMVKSLTVLSKSLRPLPLPKTDPDGNVFDAFTDPEKRYRQRYVDLVVNPHIKEAFIQRTILTNSMREYLNSKEYLEVETPGKSFWVKEPSNIFVDYMVAKISYIEHVEAENILCFFRQAKENQDNEWRIHNDSIIEGEQPDSCLLYTSDAADE